MKRILVWIIAIPVAVLLVGFAVANRGWVHVSFDPFSTTHPFMTVAMPMWGLLFTGLIVGIIAGWVMAWLSQARWRRSARIAEADLQAIRAENARLRDRSATGDLVPAARANA